MTHCSEYLQVELCGQKCILVTYYNNHNFHAKALSLYFLLEGILFAGVEADTKGQGDKWEWGAYEIHKEPIKFENNSTYNKMSTRNGSPDWIVK